MQRVLNILFLSLVFVSSPVHAKEQATAIFHDGTYAPQTIMNIARQTSQERTLLSFYRSANKRPDFKRWSLITPVVTAAPAYDKPVLALNEQVRLQTIYENIDPQDTLVLHTKISPNNYSATQNVLFLDEFRQGGAITQDIYNEKLAIIVNGISKFKALAMNTDEASFFFRNLSEDGRPGQITRSVIAEMVVKPRRAIFSKASRVGKNDHYLFVVDLAQITLWSMDEGAIKENTGKPLWTWRADWHKVEEDNADLLQLYKAIN